MTIVPVVLDGREIAERVAAQERAEVDLSTLTLEELVTRLEGRHEAVLRAAQTTLRIATEIGDILWAIRSRIGEDHWMEWTDERLPYSRGTINNYLRLSFFKDEFTAEVGVHEALESIRGRYAMIKGRPGYGSDMRKMASELAARGMGVVEIASELEIARTTVSLWLDPEAAKRKLDRDRAMRRRKAAERKALVEQRKRDERDRLARERGGNLGKAYDQVRKLMPTIDAAVSEGLPVEVRALLVRVEDEIFKALKT